MHPENDLEEQPSVSEDVIVIIGIAKFLLFVRICAKCCSCIILQCLHLRGSTSVPIEQISQPRHREVK